MVVVVVVVAAAAAAAAQRLRWPWQRRRSLRSRPEIKVMPWKLSTMENGSPQRLIR